MLYRVTMTPLEPYTLGTDTGFQRAGQATLGKTSYYMPSGEVPDQTTVLGMLRYLVLEQQQLLKTSFDYTDADYEKMKACIGEKSFSFASDAAQSFGYIQSVSPLFIMDETGNYYVKNPFHNTTTETLPAQKGKDPHSVGYCPMPLVATTFSACNTQVHLPEQGTFDAKNGHASGYYNLSTGEVFPTGDIIQSTTLVGNRKSDGNRDNDAGFYKREAKIMAKGYSFAVFVEAEQLPAQAIANMGYRKSSFAVQAEPVAQNDLIEKTQAAFQPQGEGKWAYALSDLVLAVPMQLTDFSIVEKKQMRNLETRQTTAVDGAKTTKSTVQYNLVESGSVFYGGCSLELKLSCSNIGYNTIVIIGG